MTDAPDDNGEPSLAVDGYKRSERRAKLLADVSLALNASVDDLDRALELAAEQIGEAIGDTSSIYQRAGCEPEGTAGDYRCAHRLTPSTARGDRPARAMIEAAGSRRAHPRATWR
jgi:hypothetical protein